MIGASSSMADRSNGGDVSADPAAALLLVAADGGPRTLASHIFRYLGAGAPDAEATVTRFHDALLDALGCTRATLASIDPADAAVALKQPSVAAELPALRRLLYEVPLQLIDDPAVALFLPVWLELLRDSERTPVVVLLVCDGSGSRAAPPGASGVGGESELGWLRGMLDAEHRTRGRARWILPLESLLDDWRQACDAIAAGFGGRWPRHDLAAESAIEQLVGRFRRRGAASLGVLEPATPARDLSRRCAEALRRLAAGADTAATRQLDDIRRELDAGIRLLGPLRAASAREARELTHPALGGQRSLCALRRAASAPAIGSSPGKAGDRGAAAEVDRDTLLRLFDPDWYVRQYPDLAWSGQDPLEHYREHGWLEGRNPCLLFDTGFYIGQLPGEGRGASATISVSDPLTHYLAVGDAEGMDPHPLFDTTSYRRSLQALNIQAANALIHYLTEGAALGLDPHPLFATDWYLSRLPAPADAANNPLAHFLEIGGNADFSPHPLFDPDWYRGQNADVPGTGWETLAHFVRRGGAEGRSPHPLFDAGYFRAHCPNAGAMDDNLLLDYAARGSSGCCDPHPLFENRWYAEHYPDATRSGFSPLEHYVRIGALRGYDPGACFDTGWYLMQLPGLNPGIRNPLLHYVQRGGAMGISCAPSPDALVLPLRQRARTQELAQSVAVHAHVYHPGLVRELVFYLRNLRVPFTLYVSTDTAGKRRLIDATLRRAALPASVDCRVTPNRGRDLGPFFAELSREVVQHELVCHIHTKRSAHFTFGDAWRQYLLSGLLGSAAIVESIETLFARQSNLGLVFPVTFPGVSEHHCWAANRDNTRDLLTRLGLDGNLVQRFPLSFPAGSMFWCRPQALRPLLEQGFSAADFPEEPVGEDGSILHAIERSLVYVALAQGFVTECVQVPQIHRQAPNALADCTEHG
jgi:hypothetical protein